MTSPKDLEDRADLTRIEDLGEFEHPLDSEEDKLFDTNSAIDSTQELPDISDLTGEIEVQNELPEIPENQAFETPLDLPSVIDEPEASTIAEITSAPPELPDEFPADEPEFIPLQVNTNEQENFAVEETIQITSPEISTSSETEILTYVPKTDELLESDPLPEESNKIDELSREEQETHQSVRFDDVKEFANQLSYGTVASGGNPPYSILLSSIKYLEDKEDILRILREHGLVNDQNINDYEVSLDHGSLLLSQLPEYSAIYLTHKFRRFNLNIKFGLSEEIFTPKSLPHDSSFRGLINKENYSGHKEETISLAPDFSYEDITTSTLASLPDREIKRTLGVITTHKTIEADELINDGSEESELPSFLTPLLSDLKAKAFKLKANSVVGINYQIVPLPNPEGTTRYKVICTGNAVTAKT